MGETIQKKSNEPDPNDINVSYIVKLILYCLAGFIIILSGYYDFTQNGLIVREIILLISFFICHLCGNQCAKWAKEINKSQNVAYVIGFSFGVIGLIIYSFYNNLASVREYSNK